MHHNPDQVQCLKYMQRPDTAGESQQFLQADNLMRTVILGLVKEVPLHALLGMHLQNMSRAKGVAAFCVMSGVTWTEGNSGA